MPRSPKNEPMNVAATLRKIGTPFPEFESIGDAFDQIFEALMRAYHLLDHSNSKSDFCAQILDPLMEKVRSGSDDPLEIRLPSLPPSFDAARIPSIKAIVRSMTYAVCAQLAEEQCEHTLAWAYIGNAQYCLGFVEGLLILEPALGYVVAERSKSGAQRRDAKFAPLRQLARDLAASKTYPSKRQAALGIKDEILAAAKMRNVSLSEIQAERTITGWLEGMSFGSKRQH
ncbi:hypothetical protein [Cupriavidus pauculus]|uniref:hypothetical protein n=1 Tax=Cupriavidus pauculus TaxID=82633 RepID=UPI001248478A|nr:hypothetical protein [Cupriavidus pauculus]KAB0603309.1 hypothetical protein F7R19_10080 [Cupriavidus pauculus]UAK98493.1 hypothetical protein K8O84_10680 [Cupriavidus pauculus]